MYVYTYIYIYIYIRRPVPRVLGAKRSLAADHGLRLGDKKQWTDHDSYGDLTIIVQTKMYFVLTKKNRKINKRKYKETEKKLNRKQQEHLMCLRIPCQRDEIQGCFLKSKGLFEIMVGEIIVKSPYK